MFWFRSATWLTIISTLSSLLAVLSASLSVSLVPEVAVVSKARVQKALMLSICTGVNSTPRLKRAYTNPNQLGGRQYSCK